MLDCARRMSLLLPSQQRRRHCRLRRRRMRRPRRPSCSRHRSQPYATPVDVVASVAAAAAAAVCGSVGRVASGEPVVVAECGGREAAASVAAAVAQPALAAPGALPRAQREGRCLNGDPRPGLREGPGAPPAVRASSAGTRGQQRLSDRFARRAPPNVAARPPGGAGARRTGAHQRGQRDRCESRLRSAQPPAQASQDTQRPRTPVRVRRAWAVGTLVGTRLMEVRGPLRAIGIELIRPAGLESRVGSQLWPGAIL